MEDLKLHLDAGLVLITDRGQGDLIWSGTDAQWRQYFKLAGWELSLVKPD